MDEDRTELRTKDFRTSLILIALSLFFLGRTALLPFFKADAAGVEAEWYNSAALVPYLIFGSLLLLGIGLLVVAIREGGLSREVLPKLGMPEPGTRRVLAAALIILAYIFALVPRVDFILASALVITALIYGFHQMRPRATRLALAAVLLPSAYAMAAHFPQPEWNTPHDDDIVVLVAWLALVVLGWMEARASGVSFDRSLRAAPIISVLVPLFLICVMAFGFRQNVPSRSGLVFEQIQYHYYVTLRPLWSERG